MFKYIAYDYLTDTIIATNDFTDWCLGPGNTPQQCEYFHSLEEANEWRKNHPNAHLEYLKRLEDEQNFIEADYEIEELIDEYSAIITPETGNNFLEQLPAIDFEKVEREE